MDETDAMPGTDIANVDQSLAIGLTRAEIDQQIATARAYPRSLKQVAARVLSMATLDEESAEECLYALPRGGKPIKGPSIRFAEILQQSYGNCRTAARVVHTDKHEKYVEAEGIFHDLETNAASSARVRRRIVDKYGKVYTDDMIIVTGNAACSIAKRNAILAGVPKPLWRRAYEQVQLTVAGDVTTLTENRGKAIKAFALYGLKPEQIFRALGVVGEEDITVDHITVLRGMFAALKNGEATVEEMFSGTVPGKSAHERVVNPLSDDEPAKREAIDLETGEIHDESTSPANRDESTGGRHDSTGGIPQDAGALLSGDTGPSAVIHSGDSLPAGRAGHLREGAGNRADAGAVDRHSEPAPVAQSTGKPAGAPEAAAKALTADAAPDAPSEPASGGKAHFEISSGQGARDDAVIGSAASGQGSMGLAPSPQAVPAGGVVTPTMAGPINFSGPAVDRERTVKEGAATTETQTAPASRGPTTGPGSGASGGEPSASPAIGFPPTISDAPMSAADLAEDFAEKLSMGITVKAISATYVTMYKDRIEALPIEDRRDFNPIYHAHNKRVIEGMEMEECRAICDAAIERIRARHEHVADLLGGISA